MNKRAIVVGAGFGGMSAACYLAQAGYSVTVVEKNDQPGGRAIVTKKDGFIFDVGPSWYMMPDVFEEFFADFGKKPEDYYKLVKLEPGYQVYTDTNSYDVFDAPKVYELFERLEPGSSRQLARLLKKAEAEYHVVRKTILSQPMVKSTEMLDMRIAKQFAKPELLGSYHARIARYVHHPVLQQILEFMVVFLGGSPRNIPGMYSLLSYVDMRLGIWYPMGGMNKLVDAYYRLARELGVVFQFNAEVQKIVTDGKRVEGVQIGDRLLTADIVIANADYHHVETKLLGLATEKAWQKKTLSPSGLLIYLGIDKKIPQLRHHSVFFDVDWERHFREVFEDRVWSKEPLFYVGAPSVTDPSVAPKGCENMFILAPMAVGEQPDERLIADTVDGIISRLEARLSASIKRHIVYKDVRAHNYFTEMFNAYKGNAFGLAHTLAQSAVLRPKMQHPRYTNLFFVGQYTNPGTGVPMVTLSGKAVGRLIAHNG